MQMQHFRISTADPLPEMEPLNRLLASHKIVSVDKRFVDAGENSFWSLLVTYTGGSAANKGSGPEKRIDYKEILSPDDFGVFSALRKIRKELAERDSVPAYAVFTNEQLAEIAKQRPSSRADLAKIKGVGEAKIDKYAAMILRAVADYNSSAREPTGGETNLGESS